MRKLKAQRNLILSYFFDYMKVFWVIDHESDVQEKH